MGKASRLKKLKKTNAGRFWSCLYLTYNQQGIVDQEPSQLQDTFLDDCIKAVDRLVFLEVMDMIEIQAKKVGSSPPLQWIMENYRASKESIKKYALQDEYVQGTGWAIYQRSQEEIATEEFTSDLEEDRKKLALWLENTLKMEKTKQKLNSLSPNEQKAMWDNINQMLENPKKVLME